jgi:protein KTI12
MRFETPETKNRWDSPLYQVGPNDCLPFDEIENALFNKKAPPPNKSTLNVSFKTV